MDINDSTPSGSAPGTPPGEPPAGAPGCPDKIDEFFDSVRRVGIARGQDRWVGGVASGVALRLGVDALLVRSAFVVLSLLSGAGLVLYALAWTVLPEQADGRIHLQEAIRGRFDAALAGALIAFVVGVTTAPALGWWGGSDVVDAIFWVALFAFGIYLFTTYRTKQPSSPAPASFAAQGAGPRTDTGLGADSGGPVSMVKEPAPFGAGAPPVGASPWTSQAPVVPPRAVVRGAGGASVGAVIGLSLLVLAVLLLAERTGDLTVGVWFTAASATVIFTGLATIVAGIRGRTSGALGLVAILAIFVAAPTAAWTDGEGSLGWGDSEAALISDTTQSPRDLEEATAGYTFGVGDMTVDLTELDLEAGETLTVPLRLEAGEMTVLLPDGVSASASVSLGAGQVRWQVDGDNVTQGGVGTRNTRFETDDVADGGEPDIHLVIRSGAGEVLIKEES